MVQFKEAVRRAQSYLPDIFESAAGKEMQLEGVELSDDTKFWTVTFSYWPSGESTTFLPREYKSIKLRAEDGEFFGARNGLL